MRPVSSSFLGNFTFFVGALLIAGVGVVLYVATLSARDSSGRAGHAQQIVTTLDEISEQTFRAESNQRGFLLTGTEAFAAARDVDLNRLDQAVTLLARLVEDDPKELAQVQKLRELVKSRTERYLEGERLRRGGAAMDVLASRLSPQGQGRSAGIDALAEVLRQDAAKVLALRRAEEQAQREFALKVLLFASIISALVLLPAYMGFSFQSRARDRSERMLRLINDHLPGVLYQLKRDPAGKFELTYVSGGGNRASRARMAIPDWETLVSLIDERDRPTFLAELKRAVESVGVFRCDYRVGQPPGQPEKWLHNEATLERQPDQSILFNGYLTDVTELKAMQAAVNQAQDQVLLSNKIKEAAEQVALTKSAFLATMSHEIRTPMNGVIGMTSLLLDTPLTKEQREFTEVIRQSGEGLLVVINDILDFSKIESGNMELEWQPFDLQEGVESSIELLALKAQEKKLDLVYLIQPDVPAWVYGDLTRLRQVLVNLIANALKFTEKGEVFVSLRNAALPAAASGPQAGGSIALEVCVQDTGIGIPADRLDRLFQAFSQVDSSTARRFGGTGLGLAISKRLVEAMGGRLWVESQPGVGTRFYFTFLTEAAAPVPGAAKPDNTELRGKRALLVDDNHVNLRILGLQSEGWGMVPHVCADPAEALALLAAGEHYDVVISDMHMPAMDGVAFARKARSLQGRLPIVLLSSGSIRQTAEAGLFAAVLSKPAREIALRDAVVGALSAQSTAPRTAQSSAPQFDPSLGLRNPLRILLAEDNEINRQVALRMLKGFGYQADVAANGIEAIAALHRQPYDLVLMDIQMPEMDGLEATRRIIRDVPAAARPRVVAMSANATHEDKEIAVMAGVDDYVVKPISVPVLRAALEKCGQTDMNRARRERGSGPAPLEDRPAPTSGLAEDHLHNFLQIDPTGEFLRVLIDSFSANARHLIAALGGAVVFASAEKVDSAAHELAGMSSNLGLSEMSRVCRLIQGIAGQGTVEGCSPLVAECEREFERGVSALKLFLARHREPA